MVHTLGSPYSRDQLAVRTFAANAERVRSDGAYVLYWMQATQRLDENWALRYATLEADRVGRPLLVVQEPPVDRRHATARRLTFFLEGARDVADRAAELGLAYVLLTRRRAAAPSQVERLVARAALVVTDHFPTDEVPARTAHLAAHARCRVVSVDSAGIVPVATFPREEYAARTIRPKLDRLLDESLERIEDRPPRHAPTASLLASLDLPVLDARRLEVREEVARCEVDHEVAPVRVRGGTAAARARLAAFVEDGLAHYGTRRRSPSDEMGSSRLSPYLHHGHIAAAEVARAVRDAVAPSVATEFLNEMCTWRELALNFCTRNAHHATLAALPDWVQRSMARHANDPRPVTYSLAQLESASTHDRLWNAGQRELAASGQMHNVVRMLWGKAIVSWAPTYEDALAWMVHLNDRYALDGCDPNSYAGIQWCFGKFDRPFADRAVWGTIRPMALDRAARKYDVQGYLQRWSVRQEMALA